MGLRFRASILITTLAMLLLSSSLSPLSRSLPLLRSGAGAAPPRLRRSYPCPLWSSSFSFCLSRLPKSTTTPLSAVPFCSSSMASAAAATADDGFGSNPLLKDFDFPPFHAVEPKHVRPGIRELLRRLVWLLFVLIFDLGFIWVWILVLILGLV